MKYLKIYMILIMLCISSIVAISQTYGEPKVGEGILILAGNNGSTYKEIYIPYENNSFKSINTFLEADSVNCIDINGSITRWEHLELASMGNEVKVRTKIDGELYPFLNPKILNVRITYKEVIKDEDYKSFVKYIGHIDDKGLIEINRKEKKLNCISVEYRMKVLAIEVLDNQ